MPFDAPGHNVESTEQRLCEQGFGFDFFQAIRLLEHLTPEAQAVGFRGPASREAIHFRPDVSVGFPPTDVRRITAKTDAQTGAPCYGVDVTFMGLYGVSTPLPLHYAIDILRACNPYKPGTSSEDEPGHPPRTLAPGDDTSPQRDFLDILHHRLVSLFYRAWSKYHYDATYGDKRFDVLTRYLLWLIGLSPELAADDLVVDPVRMIRYAGVLTQHPRSAVMLEGVLTDYWDGLKTEVTQFAGRWVAVPQEDQNRIGRVNATLGENLTVGADVYDLSGAFSISLGPVDWATYLRFLPDTVDHAQTRALVRLYRPDPLAFTVQVRLQAQQVPPLRLSSDDSAGRLGYTSWPRTDDLMETTVAFGAHAGQD